MKVAITGASGFIGTETIKLFKKNHIEYVGLSRGSGAEYRKTDYSIDNLADAFADVDIVIHLAAIRGETAKQGYSAFRENETLTENVLKAMLRSDVNKVIYLSSISVYSDIKQLPWSETQAVIPTNFYGLSKLMGEQLCNLYSKEGICPTIFRCAHVLGFEDNNYMLSRFFRNASTHSQLTVRGRSVAKREFIYVKDVAEALFWAVLNSRISGTFNLGSGKGYTNLEVATAINHIFVNEGNLDYQDFVDEEIKSSYMNVGLLESVGYKCTYSLDEAIRDIKTDKFD